MNPGKSEWTDSEIGRQFSRIETSLTQILAKIDLHPQMYPTRNEWDQRLAVTDKRFEQTDEDIDELRKEVDELRRYQQGGGGRVVQVLSPILAGLALFTTIILAIALRQ